jgi:adenylate cyclase
MKAIFKNIIRTTLAALILASLALGITVGMSKVSNVMVRSPLEGARNQIVDLAFQVRAHNPLFKQVTPDDIVIIDIDDASITELGRPQLWPRGYDAMVIDYLSQGNPKAIGIDYLYAEPDTFPSAYQQMLAQRGFIDGDLIMQALSTDDMLAESIAQSGKVYLSVFNDDNAPVDSTLRAYAPLHLISLDTTFEHCERLTHPVLPIGPFLTGAKGVGCISMPSMNDGSVRFYHALNQWPTDEKKFLPNFSLHMVKDALDTMNSDHYKFENGALTLGNDIKIPIDQYGSFRLNWLGQEDSIRYISYYKILDGRVPLEYFEKKYIFLGTSASGMQDLKTIPARSQKIPGVEVHAIAFLNMVNQAYLMEFKEDSSLFALYIQAFLLVLIFLIIKPLVGFVVSLASVFGQMMLFVMYIFPEFSIILPIVSMMLITIFAYLTATLYIYFIKERKSRRLKMAFSSYVSPDVVNQIAKDSSVMKLHGQKRVLSVMFSDIRGFTSYSEALEPEEVVRVLNAYLSAMSERIFKFKGTIDKFMGDGIMSIFGAPIPQKDHADRACLAALSMRAELHQFNSELLHAKGKGFEMGIGINTGAMTVGNIGSKRKFDYTVIGDSVNLGSRLESLTKYLGVDIIVSEATKLATSPGRFLFRELIPVQVKGKEKPVLIFQLIDIHTNDHLELEALLVWSNALDAYRNHDSNQCLRFLSQIDVHWPNDVVCEMMRSWCKQALATGQFNEVWSPDQK